MSDQLEKKKTRAPREIKEKKYECSKCDKRFAYAQNQKRHEKKCGDKNVSEDVSNIPPPPKKPEELLVGRVIYPLHWMMFVEAV